MIPSKVPDGNSTMALITRRRQTPDRRPTNKRSNRPRHKRPTNMRQIRLAISDLRTRDQIGLDISDLRTREKEGIKRSTRLLADEAMLYGVLDGLRF
ncbi:hypothetical protein TNCV_520201 [Trichonephila clavipes]|nr:hypothetical protein TNCV_520201 [Trichonephila clavipes]